MVAVVLPSPCGVGVMAVTEIRLDTSGGAAASNSAMESWRVMAMTPTPQGEGKPLPPLASLTHSAARQKIHVLLARAVARPVFRHQRRGTAAAVMPKSCPPRTSTSTLSATCMRSRKANNLLCAMVDNHLQHGNDLGLDPRRIVLRRVIDSTNARCATSSLAWAVHCTVCRRRRWFQHYARFRSHGHPLPGEGFRRSRPGA